ncbi:MAG: ATP-binding protein [Deltaproteobacteria bacterium]|nr:ATP-binding protein [Deltaproteobacteria bacterium]
MNRKKEIARLKKAHRSEHPVFIAVYGRRRCGKSRLLQEVVGAEDIYFVADQRGIPLQIESMASEIARQIPGFDQASYPSWDALFKTLNSQIKRKTRLILDEFPYLVQGSPELPSIIQKIIDNPSNKINLVICGSSQKMMSGLVLDSHEPLYGRAAEILKVRPLEPDWLPEALNFIGIQAVESYAVWGGVPRYWELAKRYKDLDDAIKDLIFDRDGILHNEPGRLLLDDMRSTTQAHSLLSIIANGCHRLSEIASRIGRPASSLTRPLSNLMDLAYIKRELPFGESIKSTKRTLYKLDDPFLMFWYRFVQKNRSLLEQDLINEVFNEFKQEFPMHVSEIWEELARRSVTKLDVNNIKWKPAHRWWGQGVDGKKMEIDILSESFDKRYLLFGEVKWEEGSDLKQIMNKLNYRANNFPKKSNRKFVFAYWLKQCDPSALSDNNIFLPHNIFPGQL